MLAIRAHPYSFGTVIVVVDILTGVVLSLRLGSKVCVVSSTKSTKATRLCYMRNRRNGSPFLEKKVQCPFNASDKGKVAVYLITIPARLTLEYLQILLRSCTAEL